MTEQRARGCVAITGLRKFFPLCTAAMFAQNLLSYADDNRLDFSNQHSAVTHCFFRVFDHSPWSSMAAVARRSFPISSAKDPASSESHRYSSRADERPTQDAAADHVDQGLENEFASRTNDNWTVTNNYQSESYTSLSATQLTSAKTNDSNRVKIHSQRQVDLLDALQMIRLLACADRLSRSRILVNISDVDKPRSTTLQHIVPSPRRKPLPREPNLSRIDRLKIEVLSEVSIIASITSSKTLFLLSRSIPSES